MNRVGIVLGVLLLSQTLLGRDLYVDPDRGDDGANGLAPQAGPERSGPVKTIAKAVGLAQPGDTVHLTPRPTPYRDCVLLRERSGEPGKPITIDGHGVTITGADPLRPADWTDLGEGLYRSDTLYAALRGDDSVIQRVFFLFKGRMQRMGRTSKGAKAPFKKPEDLRPGEWTFQAGSNSFYVRIAAGESLADAAIEIPYRANGVAIRGKKNEHLVLRNLTVTHFLNDGYNLHQHSKHVRFENIAAFECGDDGFSAHEGCDCEVEGYRASGNSTGFANGFGSHVKLKTAYLAGNHANEILQMHDSTFEIRDTHVVTQAARPVVVRGNAGKGQICRGSLENVLIQCRADRAKPFEIGKDAVVRANHVTTIGLSWQVEGEADVSQCVVISGGARAVLDVKPNAVWKGRQNVYDLRAFDFQGISRGSNLRAFQEASKQDVASQQVSAADAVVNRLANREALFSPCGASLAEIKLPADLP